MLAVVSSLYGFAGKRHFVQEGTNPARGIEKYREKGREWFLSAEELGRLGEAIREAETKGLPYNIDTSKPTHKHAPKETNRRTIIGPPLCGGHPAPDTHRRTAQRAGAKALREIADALNARCIGSSPSRRARSRPSRRDKAHRLFPAAAR